MRQTIRLESRDQAIIFIFALVALMLGSYATIGTSQEILILVVLLVDAIAACTIPQSALAVVLAVLAPLQWYFFIPGTNFAAPVAFIFVAIAATRILLTRGLPAQSWIVPVAAFLMTASIAALGAMDRGEAFKGIYEWAVIMACVFIVAQTVESARTVKQIILVLVGFGVFQALLGLVEYAAGLDRVLSWLNAPPGEYFFPPSLLRERLSDISFNWNLSGRALPFGTFINGIDYAVFLAAILSLALSQALSAKSGRNIAGWFAAALIIAGALLLTLKGSGLLAFAGGGLMLTLYFAPRLSRRMWLVILGVGLIALVLALPFVGAIHERGEFLIQREQGDTREIGRLEIWASLLPSYVQRPLFGYGMRNSPAMGLVLRTLRNGVFGTNPISPESAYVQVLIETGAAGLIALLALFAMTYLGAVRQIRENRNPAVMSGILAALVALWTGNLTVSAFTTDQIGVLMGLLIGVVFAKWNGS